jgi:ssRNA-specific RNase YbeY (16S rRNA maturation enzyme)
MKAINSEWRKVNKSTDVLSIPVIDVCFTLLFSLFFLEKRIYFTFLSFKQYKKPEVFPPEHNRPALHGMVLGEVIFDVKYIEGKMKEDLKYFEKVRKESSFQSFLYHFLLLSFIFI